MNGSGMNVRDRLLFLFFTVAVFFAVSAVHAQENKFKLKPGAQGKICLTCHVDFQKKLKSPFLHTPVKTGNCAGCHNPHTSSHGKLLADDARAICSRCHKNVVPEKPRSVHKAVLEGNCVNCHDPHAANNKFNLLKAGNELCYGCHKEMGEAVKKVKFKHAPVEKGCLTCHSPHGSAKNSFLLKDEVPSLCLKCHKTESPIFARQHMNYPVAKASCTGCHSPHGSDKAGMLFRNVHKPVADKMCNQCHEEPSSPNPLGVKKPGYELCRGCHNAMINDTFGKNRIHWPVVSRKGCLNCHNPHASPEKALLSGSMTVLCGKCHADTIERQERSQTKHVPVQEGNCTICHSPHAADKVFLLQQPSIIELCGTCHDWQKHSTHPIGEKVGDPRNKNLTVDCTSCHRSHGTEYKHFLYFATVTEMCTQCHVQYKR
jgi:predicted CXXCH cytochrome family protein